MTKQQQQHNVFHGVSPTYILTSSHRGSLSSTSSRTLVVSCLFDAVILTGVRCYLIMVLIFIFLMISHVEHLLICLLAICIASLEKYLFGSSVYFKSYCLNFVIELYECIFCIYLNINPFSMIKKMTLYVNSVAAYIWIIF